MQVFISFFYFSSICGCLAIIRNNINSSKTCKLLVLVFKDDLKTQTVVKLELLHKHEKYLLPNGPRLQTQQRIMSCQFCTFSSLHETVE